jgi:endonuclease/exonuclease/phosphatase family metal-dependent hydrolase
VLETRKKRNDAARLLRRKVDELFDGYISPKIIIVGDFNDQPTDKSMYDFLGAKRLDEEPIDSNLYNLSYFWGGEKKGTLKYQMQWSVFDQIIVSGTLLNTKYGLRAELENASRIDFPFLLERDEKYGGVKPKRTFYGYSYLGGFSDHLPVLLKLVEVD